MRSKNHRVYSTCLFRSRFATYLTTTMLFSLTPLLLLAAAAQASVLSLTSPKLSVLDAKKAELRSETYVYFHISTCSFKYLQSNSLTDSSPAKQSLLRLAARIS